MVILAGTGASEFESRLQVIRRPLEDRTRSSVPPDDAHTQGRSEVWGSCQTLGSRKGLGRGPRQSPRKGMRGDLGRVWTLVGTTDRALHSLKCLHKMIQHSWDAMVTTGPHRWGKEGPNEDMVRGPIIQMSHSLQRAP